MDGLKTSVNINPLLLGGIALLALIAAIALVAYRKHYRINVFFALLAILFGSGAMLLTAVGCGVGTVYAKPAGDPRATVTGFFDALVTGDYDRAYALMKDHAGLGLEKEPESEAAQLVYAALKDSYHYELIGDCQVTMLKATQRVSMRYLDVAELTGDLGDLTQEKLKTIVQTRDRDQVYDDNDQYLPAVTQEAYTNALKQVLKTAKKSYTNIEFDLNLEYRGGKWQVLTAPELLVALTGGTGT